MANGKQSFRYLALVCCYQFLVKCVKEEGERQEETRIFILFFLLSGYEEKGTINFCVGVSDFF